MQIIRIGDSERQAPSFLKAKAPRTKSKPKVRLKFGAANASLQFSAQSLA